LWYILALEPPLGLYSKSMIEDRVFLKGYRPKVFSRWSARVAGVMKSAWDEDHRIRPTMKEAAAVIRTELGAINPKYAVLMDDSQHGSPHVPR